MDENQNIAQSLNQPPQEVQAPVSNKKSLLLFAVLFILILAGVMGIFLLTNKQSTPNAPTTSEESTIPSPTVTPTTEEELDQLIIENPDGDFVDIETALNEL